MKIEITFWDLNTFKYGQVTAPCLSITSDIWQDVSANGVKIKLQLWSFHLRITFYFTLQKIKRKGKIIKINLHRKCKVWGSYRISHWVNLHFTVLSFLYYCDFKTLICTSFGVLKTCLSLPIYWLKRRANVHKTQSIANDLPKSKIEVFKSLKTCSNSFLSLIYIVQWVLMIII